MGKYSSKGLYSSYKKKADKERETLDYYATPPSEVLNILKELDIDFNNKSILEPCCGGMHMALGVQNYIEEKNYKIKDKIICTDIKDREICEGIDMSLFKKQTGTDFLQDDYPYDADIVIMNPPYSIYEPFLMKAVEISKEYLIVLARTQASEGEKRYLNIYEKNPPTDIYQYVDRIACFKNGDFSLPPQSVQAYAWFVWDKKKKDNKTFFHWIRRVNKKEK